MHTRSLGEYHIPTIVDAPRVPTFVLELGDPVVPKSSSSARAPRRARAGERSKEIADRIDPRDEPGVTHPAAHQFDGGCGHRGVDLARDAAGGGLVIELS